MTKILTFSNAQSYVIFAVFTSLLYLSPMIGGYIADKILGPKRSILIGGFLLSTGYFLLAIPGDKFFYLALAVIITGNGFFMPNISSILGAIYLEQDSRREGGFSILYSAINIGAFIPPIISAWIIFQFCWHAAFFIAGIGVIFGVTLFYFTLYNNAKDNRLTLKQYSQITGLIISMVGFLFFLMKNNQLANFTLFTVSFFFVGFTIKKAFQFDPMKRQRILTCLLLTCFSIIFCILCEQAAMSLTIYTEYNVNRHFYNWEFPTVSFLSLNPFFIIVFGPIISSLWIWLDKKGLNPSIPTKFAYGTILVGLGFVIFPVAMLMQSNMGQIHFWWIVLSYLVQSLGELLVYPVGLSMMTELVPKQMMGLMIGTWYFATAIANVLGGFASVLTTGASNSNDPALTSATFGMVFGKLGWLAVGVGILIFLLTPILKRSIKA